MRAIRFSSTALFALCFLFRAAPSFAENLKWAAWARASPSSAAQAWTFAPGDFNGDGRLDAAGYNPANGEIRLARNTGQRQFTMTSAWATVSPSANWTILSGEFTNDGRPDLFAYHPSDGSIWVFRNTGSSFSFERWGTVAPAANWSFVAGDFNGDGRLDIAAYHTTGSIYVGVSSVAPSGVRYFAFAPWATVTPAAGWVFQSGDFNRDGLVDIVGHHPSDGSVYVGRNTGSAFSFAFWGRIALGETVSLLADRFAGNSNIDLGVYRPAAGTVSVGQNAPDRFVFDQWGTVAPASGWKVAAGDFTGNGRIDVLAYYPGDGSLSVGDNVGPDSPSGYVWPLSAAPGQTLNFMTSGVFEPTVRFFRYRALDPDFTAVGQRLNVVSIVQSVPTTAQPDGAGWQPVFSWTIPNNGTWKSGLYSARLVKTDPLTGATTTYDIPFIVKPAPSARKSIAVLANVNTWNAYNRWNGRGNPRGKYDGAATTSFLRPYLTSGFSGSPTYANDYHLARSERLILGWLEDNGFDYDLYSDIDFHDGAVTYAAGYRKLVLSTHPEYWTTQMRQKLDSFLAAGGSLVYLGGNGIFETLTYGDQTNCNSGAATCIHARATYFNGHESNDGTADDWRAPAMFRVTGPHERNVLGVATASCSGGNGSPYRIRNLNSQIFAGTGLTLDGRFGTAGHPIADGSHGGGASGSEIDRSLTSDASGIPCNLSSAHLPPDHPLPLPSVPPPNLILLAVGCDVGLPDGSPPGYNPDCAGAHMTFYWHSGGGFVFSAGSILFGRSLSFPTTTANTPIQKIVKNVMNLSCGACQ